MLAEIENGVQFQYMTFGGQVPGPMIRVRQGDTVTLTFKSSPDNAMLHNVDFHAAYGTGGGETVEVTFTAPQKLGDYNYVCTFPGHYMAGMKGTLRVE